MRDAGLTHLLVDQRPSRERRDRGCLLSWQSRMIALVALANVARPLSRSSPLRSPL